MNVIFLTQSQADAVRGETSPGHMLDPVQYGEGFILPTAVLRDPAHAEAHVFLSSLPLIDVSAGIEQTPP